MIYLALVRRAQCEICECVFDINVNEQVPKACISCGSTEWLYGPAELESRRIRMLIKRSKVVLNPGAKSLKRRAQGERQYQGFKSKEEVDAKREAAEN